MKKRMITLAMALCLALSLAVPAYAASGNSVSSQVEQDMAAMKSAHFYVDAISVDSTDGDTIKYAYRLTEDVVDYITVQHNDDGSSVLDIWEEDRNDTITVTAEGTLLFNGQALYVENAQPQPRRAPGRTTYVYSASPFPGTSGYYSTTASPSSNPNVPLVKQIREETASIIGSVLAEAVFPGNKAAQDACSKIFVAVAVRLRTNAEATADSSNKLSYKSYLYSCSKSDSYDLYRKHKNVYYCGANFVDPNPVTDIFYEHRIHSAG